MQANNSGEQQKAYPGMLLGSCVDFKPSQNTYSYLGNIYASKTGFIVHEEVEDEAEREEGRATGQITAIKVVNKLEKHDQKKLRNGDKPEQKDEDSQFGGDKNSNVSEQLIPREGSQVFARIVKLEERFALCKILSVGDTPLPKSSHFSGIIFREHVRDYDRDNIKIHHAFAPNDIIKA